MAFLISVINDSSNDLCMFGAKPFSKQMPTISQSDPD